MRLPACLPSWRRLASRTSAGGSRSDPGAGPGRVSASRPVGGRELQLDLEPGDDEIYVDEAVEQIERIERGLLELEAHTANQASLAEIFRAAHTLKGSAATVGHARMAELTHALEDVFGALRDGRLEDVGGFGDLLLSTVDVLRVLVDEVAAGKELTDAPGPLAGSIRRCLQAILAGDPTQGMSGTSMSTGTTGRTGAATHLVTVATVEAAATPTAATELDAARIAQLLDRWPANDAPQSLVTVSADDASEWTAVRLLQALMAASDSGQLLGSVPTLEEVESGNAGSVLTILVHGAPDETDSLARRLGAIEEVDVTVIAVVAEGTARTGDTGQTLRPQAPTSRRAASHTIRIEVGQLDDLMDLVGELIVQKTRLRRQARQLAVRLGDDPLVIEADDGSRHFAQIVTRLQGSVTQLRMLPIETIFNRFPRLVRDLAAQLGKEVDLSLEGSETGLDRSLLEEIVDPLGHLIRNALDHGIEPAAERAAAGKASRGMVRVTARHADGRVLVEVADDGRGMDPVALAQTAVARGLLQAAAADALSPADALQLVFMPGFSTTTEVTSVSGRGVGMDVVRANVERLGGRVTITSTPGIGSTITMSLPLTLAIIDALLVRSGDRICAIPLGSVIETQRIPWGDIETVTGTPVLNLPRGVVPFQPLGAAMGDHVGAALHARHMNAVLVQAHGAELALGVDEFLGAEEVVLKSLGIPGQPPSGIAGGTILADGRVALVIDVERLIGPAGAGRSAA
jgi:two-component system chemotaxis sensor kinase CheA